MIDTPRLILRSWRETDLAPFHAINADPQVMRHLGPTRDRQDSDSIVERLREHERDTGLTFWAVERRDDGRLLGFCGLKPGPAETPLFGSTEIGWRFASDAWGKGYARESAAASLAYGWARGIERITAMTIDANTASWGLMIRLGMRRRLDLDFDHPALPDSSPLRRHIVYEIDRP